MFDRFSGPDRTIVAAIDIDSKNNKSFVNSLQEWAARTGMSVHLVHVIQPWTAGYSSAFYPGEYTTGRIAELAELKRLREAEANLEKLAKTFSPGTRVTHTVEIGLVVQSLMQEINLKRTTLVACNIDREPSKFVPNVFSTALTLMATANVPVIVFPNDVQTNMTNRELKLLVCDALEEGSQSAVGAAFEMAMTLEDTSLYHLHVHPKTKEELEQWAADVLEMMNAQKIEWNDSFGPGKVFAKTKEGISKKLGKRFAFEKQMLESKSKGRYHQEIRFGDVPKEVADAVEKIDPDFVIFGRHQLIHTKPFNIGKVPFASMLSLHKPTIMVPHILSI